MPKAIPSYVENVQGRRQNSHHGVTKPGDRSGPHSNSIPLLQKPPNPIGQATILPSQEVISPWFTSISARQYDTVEERVHAEIVEFAFWASPTPSEVKENEAILDAVARSFKKFVQSPNRIVKIIQCGSLETGLSLPNSNLNLEYYYENEAPRMRAPKDIHDIIVRSGMAHKNFVAAVPPHESYSVRFIMLRELGGRLVSLNKTLAKNAGVSSLEVKQLLARHPALRPLYLVAKAFLSRRGLTDAQDVNGMAPPGLLKLCVRFLETNPCNRPDHVLRNSNSSLGTLLGDFFYYFGFRNIKAVKEVMEKFCTRDQGQKPSKKGAFILAVAHCDLVVLKAGDDTVGRTNMKKLTSEIERHFKAVWEYLRTRKPTDTNILGPIVAIDQDMVNRRIAITEVVTSGRLEEIPVHQQRLDPTQSSVSTLTQPPMAPDLGKENEPPIQHASKPGEKGFAASTSAEEVYLKLTTLDGM